MRKLSKETLIKWINIWSQDSNWALRLPGEIQARVQIIKLIKGQPNEKQDIVQKKNPISGLYLKINRTAGKIISHKKSKGAYKNIPISGN